MSGEAGANVLLIDSEQGVAESVRRALQDEGFRVSLESDRRRGEQCALREEVDLVVLDMTDSGPEGIEVLARLNEAKPELPVILTTRSGKVEDCVAGLDAGADDYVIKPFSASELAARIRAQLRRVAFGRPTDAAG